jgi:ribosomal protein S18 acetylase RimI-like enzyme
MSANITNITLRSLTEGDLLEVARIHCAAFPKELLTMLGTEAVRRYYLWQLIGPHDTVALGAFREQELVGYCFAGVFRGATSGFLRHNRLFLVGCALKRPGMILHPKFYSRLRLFLRALRPKKSPPSPIAVSDAPRRRFGILAIAVHPACQGEGVGKALMRESEAIAKSQGFQTIALSVAPDNTQAIQFYQRQGFRHDQTSSAGQIRMVKDLAHLTDTLPDT